MRKKYVRYLLVVLGGLVLIAGVSALKHKKTPDPPDVKEETIISPEAGRSALYREIRAAGREYEIAPVNARVDRVWKAIPGYNGLQVDADASYLAMQTEGKLDRKKLVFREIPPRVHLGELEPQPIYRGNPAKPMAAFLINVAWGNEYIPKILETLAEHQIKTTFFLDGSWVEKNPDLAMGIYKAGHEIGNHAYSHPDLQTYSRAQTREEIKKTNDIITATLGVKPVWFAPPSGSFNRVTVQTAHELGMKTILWTVDTVDWRQPAAGEMVQRVVSKVENGAMILMHPTRPTAEGLGACVNNPKNFSKKFRFQA